MIDRTHQSSSTSHMAVVVGASISGLLTARVLSNHFEQVVVLERDWLPDEPTPRVGVPQEHHVHLLLQRGKRIIERFFPGITAELESEGALAADLCLDVKCFQAGRWKQRWPSGITAHYCTRTLLEHILRRRVRALQNVQIFERTDVAALNMSADGLFVSGVRVIPIGKDAYDIPTALVVDASGRGSKATQWLGHAGLPQPYCEEIITRLGYVSGIYEPLRKTLRDWKVLLCLPKLPSEKRMAVVSPIEGGRWMVTAGAWFGEQPLPEESAFLDYLRQLPVPNLYDEVRQATLIGPLKRFRMPGGLRRHFDRMPLWPNGFLVVGDAVCSINPIYSQGMSASALQVEAMHSGLAPLLAGQSTCKALQRIICASVDLPWQQAASVEHRFELEGNQRGLHDRILSAYFDRLIAASAGNRNVAIAMLRVNNLIADPRTLFAPSMALSAMIPGLSWGHTVEDGQ
jgi:2-polyprenyl-6-methoxyphenol hydroxylase-like FAD-dependent oxidoreductase